MSQSCVLGIGLCMLMHAMPVALVSLVSLVSLVRLRRAGSLMGVNSISAWSVIRAAVQHGGRSDALHGYRQRQQRDHQEAEQLDHGELIMTGDGCKGSCNLGLAGRY